MKSNCCYSEKRLKLNPSQNLSQVYMSANSDTENLLYLVLFRKRLFYLMICFFDRSNLV